jgi:hypothetical protein
VGISKVAKRLSIIAMMIAFLSGFSSNAAALSITDPGVVGAYHGSLGGGSNLANELALAQFLLNMAASSSDSNGPALGGGPCNISTATGCAATSNVEYAAVIATGIQAKDNDFTVDAGFQFALAKYGSGQNQGGYVLYALNGAATSLPLQSNTLWGKSGTQQYGLSHFTAFSASTTFRVPDGGATMILLGAALGGLGVLRRRFNS